MHETLWNDDEFRTFLSTLRTGGIFGNDVDDTERWEFIRQARLRIVPEVQRRLLADVGVPVDPYGVAIIAFEALEESWGKRRTWLLASSDPWGFLTDLVTRELRSAYRSAARKRGDGKQLAGIASASTRPELEEGPAGE
jgi:hypothetical protein